MGENSEGLLVGQVASLAGVTVKAVRHYEKLGLIQHASRESNGYKRYDREAVVRVACVAALRRAGMPLTRVSEVLEGAPTAASSVEGVLEVLRGERDRIDEQLASLESLAAAIAMGEGPLEELGRPFVEEVSVALGSAARDVDDEVWRVERRVAGMFAAFGVVVDDLPDAAREYIRLHAGEVAEALQADAALAQLRDVGPEDPRVESVAKRLQSARPIAQALRDIVGLSLATPGPAGELLRSKLSAAQRQALRKAGAGAT